ncbi:hypothetical protein F5Y19DRAFT_280121 [Xylariaceae sp. FL1651]|nr:hypothetical protein F5Y19DRAFT_280121 [Xylariaceae sp. FL1651]
MVTRAMEHYSNLEVRLTETPRTVQYDQSYPETVPNYPDSARPQAVPLEHDGYGVQVAEKGSEVRNADPRSLLNTAQAKRRCGLPIRLFYTVLGVVVLLLIGAIVGGVAGGISASRRGNHSHPGAGADGNSPANNDNNGNVTGTTNAHILAASEVASSNWTDPNGYAHRFVFFQDPSGAIIARRWESQNQTWITNNLTNILSPSRSPLNPLAPSTPLASASCNWANHTMEVHVWYLAPDNTIAGAALFHPADDPEAWQFDSLGGTTINTWPASQLAAAWQRCWTSNCAGNWALAYQRPDDAGINVANASYYSKAPLAIDQSGVAQGSSLALIPQLDVMGPSVDRLVLMSESLGTPTSGKVQKTTYDSKWYSDGTLLPRAILPAPSSSLKFAITVLDSFATTVFLALLPNGTVTGEYYRGHGFTEVPSIEFRSGPASVNFSAIAASEDAMFYGISGDEILQYKVNESDPSIFEFVEKIYP